MSYELVDSHTHLNDKKFLGREREVIERANKAKVTRLINMGDTMESSAKAVELAKNFAGVYAGVGIHPEEAYEMTAADDDRLADWAQDKKVVAIGEIGLDYYWEKDSEKRLLQQRIFIRQLDLARQLHLPVCVHDREAHGDTMAILKREGKGIAGVMHCFSGSYEMAEDLRKMGWYIGVDGPLTYKNAAKLPDIAARLPLEMILVETDAPYLAPVPLRGKENEPAYVQYVAEKLAEIKKIPLELAANETTKNAINLYHLD